MKRVRNPEMPITTEFENRPTSEIVLHLFRHGPKGKGEEKERLSPEGKTLMHELGKTRGNASDTSLAYGSDVGDKGHERALLSAELEMAGALGIEGVDGTESMPELEEKLRKWDEAQLGAPRGKGKRHAIDPRLGFALGSGETGKKGYKAFIEGTYMDWAINESDRGAIEHHDNEVTTYTRASGQIAEMTERYVTAAKRWDELANNPEKGYGKVLERFIGSHAGAVDLFLVRLVEKSRGTDERDKLVAALKGGNFEPGEGFDIIIDTISGAAEPRIRIRYDKKDAEGNSLYAFDETVPNSALRELIEDMHVMDAETATNPAT